VHATMRGSPCILGSRTDSVVCACNVGYSGNGMKCTFDVPARSISLIILVTLPMSMDEFSSKENGYIISIASAAKVSTSSVEIMNITPVSNRRTYNYTADKRLLMSIYVQVKTSISSDTANKVVIEQDYLNSCLNENGLPKGVLAILSNVSLDVASTSSSLATSLSALAPTASTAALMNISAIAGISVATVVFLLMVGGILRIKVVFCSS
jgi:hypothetical protein